jgi:hypothetical protein
MRISKKPKEPHRAGRYEVIFGDLRAETVTAERLRALEAK